MNETAKSGLFSTYLGLDRCSWVKSCVDPLNIEEWGGTTPWNRQTGQLSSSDLTAEVTEIHEPARKCLYFHDLEAAKAKPSNFWNCRWNTRSHVSDTVAKGQKMTNEACLGFQSHPKSRIWPKIFKIHLRPTPPKINKHAKSSTIATDFSKIGKKWKCWKSCKKLWKNDSKRPV